MASKGTADARDAKWSAAAQPLAPGVCHKRRCDEHRPLRLPWPDSARCVHFSAQEGPRAGASYSARREDLRGDPPSGDQAVAQGESSLLHAASRTDLPREVRLVTAGGVGGEERERPKDEAARECECEPTCIPYLCFRLISTESPARAEGKPQPRALPTSRCPCNDSSLQLVGLENGKAPHERTRAREQPGTEVGLVSFSS